MVQLAMLRDFWNMDATMLDLKINWHFEIKRNYLFIHAKDLYYVKCVRVLILSKKCISNY